MKCKIVPAIFGIVKMVTKGLSNKFKAKTRTHSIDSVQKTAVHGTSHIRNTESTAG